MRHLNFSIAMILAAAFSTVCSAQDEPTGWTAELALQVKRVGSVEVSPDGARVAYTVSEAVMDGETSTWRTHIHMADADGTNGFQFTRGEKSCASPQWSPDGIWLAFTTSRGSEKANLRRINVNGGEAEQLTELEGGLSSFKFSPDGTQIAFVMSDPATEDEETDKKEKNDAKVVDEELKMGHLYLIPAEPNDEGERPVERLTTGDFNVGVAFGGGAFDWSPEGLAIAFTHVPTSKVDDWPKADISILDLETKYVQPLVFTGAAEAGPVYSPDGNHIAYSASDDPPTWAFTSRVHLIDATGGEPRALASTFDEQPSILGWNETGDAILVAESYKTVNRVYMLPIDGREAADLTPPGAMVGAPNLDRSRRFLGFTSETPNRAPEAFFSSASAYGDPVQVSHAQDLPDLPIGQTTVIDWTSTDGMAVQGLLTYPVNYEPGTRVALLVIVHGGPTGVFTQRFTGSRGAYPIAAFTEKGYAVLRCNPRGSSGYGKDFRYANYDDWGFGDFRDIMAGVDHVIEMGVADAQNLGIMGWSYGGYMTSWVITQTHRFRAASVGAGVTNLMSFTGTADIPGFIPDYFHGEYWENFDAYRKHSAMFNVAGVTTPTLIQHGEKDARVPISQGYEFYNALLRQDVPVKMVVYPRQPHGIREPRLQLDAMKRNLDWFDQWLTP